MFYVCGWRKTFYEQSYSECLARWGLDTWCELTHSNIKHVIVAHIRTHARMICLIDDNDDAFERKFPRYPWRINYTELKNFSEHPMWTNIRPYSLRYQWIAFEAVAAFHHRATENSHLPLWLSFCFIVILTRILLFLLNRRDDDAPSVSHDATYLVGSVRCSRCLGDVSLERRRGDRKQEHTKYNERKRG